MMISRILITCVFLTIFVVHCPVVMSRTVFVRPQVPSPIPFISDVQNPPIPDQIGMTTETQNLLRNTSTEPELRPGLFQGDIALSSEGYHLWRVGLRWDVFPDRMWQNRTVPYVISDLYRPEEYITIYRAIMTLNFLTCIKFVPWDGKKKDYIIIWPIKFPQGCWSYVGRAGGPQILSLQPPDDKGPQCLGNEGRALHELTHALGIFHEQSRADRDQFVEIVFDHVVPGFENNFDKQSKENTTYYFEYDYKSIMHYGKYFFSKEKGLPTIVPKMKGVKIGQRRGLSKTDCLKINELYGCLDGNASQRRRYFAVCDLMGL